MAKARKQKLKVFRTAIGFHDAYVAAPSRQAALVAWGADSDLFAAGMAELVSDPALTAGPLASPGAVIRRARGTAAEHVTAVEENPGRTSGSRSGSGAKPSGRRTQSGRPRAKVAKKTAPRPSRAKLDLAEEMLAAAEKKYKTVLREIDVLQAALDRQRRDVERRHEAERGRAANNRDQAKGTYERAMRAWQTGRRAD